MTAVKCVVWDLDNTLWRGTEVETPDTGIAPPVDTAMLNALRVLEDRGIVNSVASRTDASILELLHNHPQLAGRFIAPQLSWGDKSNAIRTIAETLGIDTTDIALIDDSAFERAEVTANLPGVRVYSPHGFLAHLDTTDFTPSVITDDARQRPRRYREHAVRRAAEHDFTGARERFLHHSDIRLDLRAADKRDADRLIELIDRTHRLNTTGEAWTAGRIHQAITDPAWFVPVARLTDRFGDYGLTGTAIINRNNAESWHLRILAVSCRAAGRGMPAAFLSRILHKAHHAGAQRVLVDIRPSKVNLELRVLLRAAGFTADTTPDHRGMVTLGRPAAEQPPTAAWLTIREDYRCE